MAHLERTKDQHLPGAQDPGASGRGECEPPSCSPLRVPKGICKCSVSCPLISTCCKEGNAFAVNGGGANCLGSVGEEGKERRKRGPAEGLKVNVLSLCALDFVHKNDQPCCPWLLRCQTM